MKHFELTPDEKQVTSDFEKSALTPAKNQSKLRYQKYAKNTLNPQIYIVTISKNGVITLPKPLRDFLKVQPGDKLVLKKTKTGVIVKKFTLKNY